MLVTFLGTSVYFALCWLAWDKERIKIKGVFVTGIVYEPLVRGVSDVAPWQRPHYLLNSLPGYRYLELKTGLAACQLDLPARKLSPLQHTLRAKLNVVNVVQTEGSTLVCFPVPFTAHEHRS
jgi:hypothetical protein